MNKSSILKIFLLIIFLFTSNIISGKDLSVFDGFTKPKFRIFMVANQDYRGNDMDLRYTINDITVFEKIFSKVLKVPKNRLEFHKNLSLNQFLQKTKQFSNKIKKNELIVIIFTGHGNTNGMPIFVDKKTVAPKDFFHFMNSFKNDTILIMDSCYSGAEGAESNMLSSNNVDESTEKLRPAGSGKEVQEKKGYRKNVLRIYSSLAHQQSREARYKKIPQVRKHLGETYNFLEELGYNGDGNGIFSITFASFFADQEFNEKAYTFDSINSYINVKVSAMQNDGIDSQRPKMIPYKSPFNNNKNYFILAKEYKTIELSPTEKLYYNAVIAQSQKKYQEAVKLFEKVLDDTDYKDTRIRLAECYTKIGQALGFSYINQSIEFFERALKNNQNQLEALNSLGQINLHQENYNTALKYFKKVAELSERSQNLFWVANSNNNIGAVYTKQGEDNKAIEHFNKAATISRKINDFTGEATAYNNIGGFYFRKSKPNKAIEYFKKSSAVSKQSGDVLGVATAQNNIAIIYIFKRNHKLALKNFMASLKILKSYNRTKEVAVCYNNIAMVYEELKKYSTAKKYYSLAYKIYKKEKYNRGIAESYNNLGMISLKMKKYKSSLSYLKKSLKLNKKIKDRIVLAEVYSNLGIAYNTMKKYKKALKYLLLSRKLNEQLGSADGVAKVLVNLMEVYESIAQDSLKKKKYKDSIKYSYEAIEIYKKVDDQLSIARVYGLIGVVYFRQEQLQKSIEFFEISLNLYQKSEDENGSKFMLGWIARVSNDLGVSYSEDEDYDKAFKYLNRSLEISREIKEYTTAAATAQSIASLYSNLKNTKQAIHYFKISLELFKKNKDYNYYPDIYFNIASTYYSINDFQNAYKNFKNALYYYKKYTTNKAAIKETSRNMGISAMNLADNHFSGNNHKKAMTFYKISLNLFLKIKLKDISTEKAYEGVVKSYMKLKQYKNALYYQKKFVNYLKSINSPKAKVQIKNLQNIKEQAEDN